MAVARAHPAAAPWRPVPRLGAFTLWAAAAPSALIFAGTARPMPDRVDYKFRNGWVETGDLPCREALRAALPDRVHEAPDGPFEALAVADEGAELDFSTFCHRPTLIRRGFHCRLRSEAGGPARLRIATCGGVRLWLRGAPVASFEPFERNQPQAAEVTVPIPAGVSDVMLALEDLHERDTTNYFSLVFLDGPTLETALPAGFVPEAAIGMADLLAGLHLDGVFHQAGPVRLHGARPVEAPIRLKVDGPAQFLRGGISSEPGAVRRTDVVLGPAQSAEVFDVGEASAGCQRLVVSAEAGGAVLARAFGTTVLRQGRPLDGPLPARKAAAGDEIARHAGFEPTVATLLALRGAQLERVADIARATLTTIEERHDCSDFGILPLLRLWRDGRESLPQDLQERMRAAFLGYRYWLSEPGNDVMWFWSENHVLCFHTAQLVAGSLFPDAVFSNSGRTGRELADEARGRLKRWFASIDQHGLCEWNSAAYYPIDMLGLLTLYDMAPELRGLAGRVLDRILSMTALHTSGDVPAGSQGRCYEKELLAGAGTELGSVAAIAFGRPYVPGYDRAAALLCLSDYAPPKGLDALCRPPEGRSLTARYTQGLDHAGKLSLWKSADVQLSTATSDSAGQQGHQAHVIDVQAAAHPMARLWINHPGELKEWGDRRPSLLAGNHVMPQVAQHEETALLIYDLERDWTHIGFTQLFAPKGAWDALERAGDWWIFGAGAARVGVWCSAALAPVDGTYAGSLWRAHALRVGWALTVAGPRESALAFEARLQRTAPSFDAGALTLRTQASDGTELALGFGAGLRIDGRAAPFAPLSTKPHVGWNGAPLEPWSAHDQ